MKILRLRGNSKVGFEDAPKPPCGTNDVLNNLKTYRPSKMDLPLRCEFDFVHTGFTQRSLLIPGCEMVGPRTVTYMAQDREELLRYQLLLLAAIRPAQNRMY